MSNPLIHRVLLESLETAFRYFPVVTLVGPRQSGKTTLCRRLFAQLPYVNLEDISTLTTLSSDPKGFLARYPQGLIIDEVQRYPELFSYLQVIVDEDRMNDTPAHRYILTGSANFSIMQQVVQSMAGRTAIMTLLPLSTQETDGLAANTYTRILRGGYPGVWRADDEGRTLLLSNYYTTYVERDLRLFINIKDLTLFHRFIRLCAGRIGSECNLSALSVECGVSQPTVQSWLSILEASYIIYRLPPYYANIGKRLVKTPKLYFYDTGLAAWLLGIQTEEQLMLHPLRGCLFENMVINDACKYYFNRGLTPSLFFYRDQRQHEVDLLDVHPDGTISAYEIKSSSTFHSDYLSGLHYLRRALGDSLTSTTLIYDGTDETDQPHDAVRNARSVFRV